MALARWQATIVDGSGNIQAGASVEVRRESDNVLVSLFTDRAGTISAGNPVLSDSEGYVYFHVAGGAYKITATLGAFTRVWRYVAIGTAMEFDFSIGAERAIPVFDTSGLTASSASISAEGTLTLAPTTGLSGGVLITQNATGAVQTYSWLNRLLIQSDDVLAQTLDSPASPSILVGLDIAHLFGGGSGARTAVNIEARRTAPGTILMSNQDVGLGFSFNAYSHNNGSFGAEKGNGYAGFATAHLGSATGNSPETYSAPFWDSISAFQFGLGISQGSSASAAIGVRIGHNPYHAVKGYNYDTALDFVDDTACLLGWDALITSSGIGGKVPLDPTVGVFIRTLGAQTFLTGIDMTSATMTYFLRGPGGFDVGGNGNMVTASAFAHIFGGENSCPLTIKSASSATLPQLDTTSTGQSALWAFLSAATVKWYAGKDTADQFIIHDAAAINRPVLWSVSNSGVVSMDVMEMSEQSPAPSAGAANSVRLYAEDDGSSPAKTKLMALFNTGAAQQIAIEP